MKLKFPLSNSSNGAQGKYWEMHDLLLILNNSGTSPDFQGEIDFFNCGGVVENAVLSLPGLTEQEKPVGRFS